MIPICLQTSPFICKLVLLCLHFCFCVYSDSLSCLHNKWTSIYTLDLCCLHYVLCALWFFYGFYGVCIHTLSYISTIWFICVYNRFFFFYLNYGLVFFSTLCRPFVCLMCIFWFSFFSLLLSVYGVFPLSINQSISDSTPVVLAAHSRVCLYIPSRRLLVNPSRLLKTKWCKSYIVDEKVVILNFKGLDS